MIRLRTRIAGLAGGVVLLLVGLFVLCWAVLVAPEARVPVGEGWIDGHFYHQTSDSRATLAVGTAGLFGLAAWLVALAVSQIRLAYDGRRLALRWLIGVPTVVMIASCALTLTQPSEFCNPSVCRDTSGEMH